MTSPSSEPGASVGIIIALSAECRSLGIRLSHKGGVKQLSPNARATLSGAGPDNARNAAAALANQGARALLSWGCCAALAPELKPGALLLPEAVLDDRNCRVAVDPQWRQRLQDRLVPNIAVHSGLLVQSHEIIATPAAKSALAQSSHAVAVDMESAAIAQVAEQQGLPFLAIRAVADSAQMALPRCVLDNTDADGDTHIGGLLLSLARQPAELPALLALGRHFATAMAALRQSAKLIGPDFLFSP